MSPECAALLLKAISLVETGGDPRAVGRLGERGAFQMMPAVRALHGGVGQAEAARHLKWLHRQLEHNNVDPLPFNLALAWNAGAGAVLRGQAPMASYDYAQRVENTLRRLQEVSP